MSATQLKSDFETLHADLFPCARKIFCSSSVKFSPFRSDKCVNFPPLRDKNNDSLSLDGLTLTYDSTVGLIRALSASVINCLYSTIYDRAQVAPAPFCRCLPTKLFIMQRSIIHAEG
ncbi:hypothetical protein Zmor_025936 [Zophobas morio]|uniref:Uncharacterized protein n=1 Tax=Zophobas morio TaxID=2755281 RepID=A0AA38HV14_9CUCU|nr:hypothetical protein Zmor_025936 [Zophobas morio]